MADQRFPRGPELPTQSPAFWVEQKDRYLRQLLIRDIETLSGRRLLVLFSNRFVRGSEIGLRDIAYIYEMVGDALGAPVDLLLETNGGETDATESIVSLLRTSVPDYRVVIANGAKSNGTLLALSATSIVMGATSELGPIEPALAGLPVSTLLLDRVKQENFGLHIAAVHALRQSEMLATQFLAEGMMKGASAEDVARTVSQLATRHAYPSHGSVIDRAEASKLGLQITSLDCGDPLWDRIWLLYCMYDFDARRAGVAKIFEGRARSLSVGALPPTQAVG